MGRTFEPADGVFHSIWGGSGSWGFGTVWHKRDDTAVAAIAVLGWILHRYLWDWQLCHVFAQQVYPHQTGARHATAILFGTLAIIIFLFIFNGLFSMRLPETALDMLTLFAQTGLIVATVNGVLAFYNNNKKPLQPTETVRVLQRLPIDKRGELISMTVMDHYVELTTTRGKHLILMQFKDAIAEIPPQLGMQIHRTYWVASDQVQAHRRDGKQLLLITTAQDALPVSRRYQKAV